MSPRSRKGYYVDGEYVRADAGTEVGADDGQGPGTPSRTARKNASTELQKTGEALLALRRERLAQLDLPERLHDAIVEAKRLTQFGAKRRQMQFIGKLMRKLDPDVLAAVDAALSAEQPGRRAPRDARG